MGEDGGAVEVAVAVDGVGAVDDGDAEAGCEGPPLHLVHHIGPLLGRRAFPRGAAAAVEDAANETAGEGGGGGDGPLDLGHLAGLLRQRHTREQVPNPRLDGLVRILV